MKRETAIKARVKTILEAPYITQEGWNPNYLDADQKIIRVNVIGTVVDKESQSMAIDDGTGTLPLRNFESQEWAVEVGDVVQVIGHPREYQNERFVVPEIVKKVDPGWFEIRKKELSIETPKKPKPKQEDAIVDKIQAMDEGEGVSTEQAIKTLNITEDKVKALLEEGEVFEIKPGILKVL